MGVLDELVLDRYPRAGAVLIDGSEPMPELGLSGSASAHFVAVQLAQPGWGATVGGSFDVSLQDSQI
jgi:hypothetical protein